METISICTNCQHQNKHDVDNNGQAQVKCELCSALYSVQCYQVRAKGGRFDRRLGVKYYNVRVKEPDKDESLLQFISEQDIEMRSGDWITGSFLLGKLKYLINLNIKKYWDVQPAPPSPPPRKPSGFLGCLVPTMVALSIVISLIIIIFIFT